MQTIDVFDPDTNWQTHTVPVKYRWAVLKTHRRDKEKLVYLQMRKRVLSAFCVFFPLCVHVHRSSIEYQMCSYASAVVRKMYRGIVM